MDKVDPCNCGDKSCPALRGMVRDPGGFWTWPKITDITEA